MKRERDKIEAIRELILEDKVNEFRDIFDKWCFAPTSLALGIRKNTKTLTHLINHPEEFKIRELVQIARYFGVDYKLIALLIERNIRKREQEIMEAYENTLGMRQRAKAMRVVDKENQSYADGQG